MIRAGNPLLFLDFDGVLHPFFPRHDLSDAENRLFSCLPRLENVLRDFQEVEIVITSSWREGRPWEKVIEVFSSDIVPRIAGMTPVITTKWPPYPEHPRYDEIQAYLAESGQITKNWLALDDDPRLFPPSCPQLILCADGFRGEEELRLREALA